MEQVQNLPVLASSHEINLLGYQGSQWVSGEVVGQKLGYAHPRKYINNLYNRHKNEFKEGENIVFNLRTMFLSKRGKKSFFERKVRLFSVPNGAFRLCMISDAPNRQEVHDDILELFDTYRFGYMLKSLPNNQPITCTDSFMREVKKNLGPKRGKEIIKSLFNGSFDGREYFTPIEELARIADGSCRRAAIKKEAEKRGCHINTIYKEIEVYRKTFGINKLPTKLTGEPRRQRSNKGVRKNPAEYQQAMEYKKERPKAGGAEIKRALGLSCAAATINRWIREAYNV